MNDVLSVSIIVIVCSLLIGVLIFILSRGIRSFEPHEIALISKKSRNDQGNIVQSYRLQRGGVAFINKFSNTYNVLSTGIMAMKSQSSNVRTADMTPIDLDVIA